MKKKIRIGCGAGFSGDRIEPAIILAEQGALEYLVLECLAERTIAFAQKRKLADPFGGYDSLLEKRISGLLPFVIQNKIRLITNMGAANPIEAAKKIIEIGRKLNLPVTVAALTGDDVLQTIMEESNRTRDLENGRLLNEYNIISANAYLGADSLLLAIQTDAQIIITGRVADPSLFLAPMIHEFGWDMNDADLMGKGTVIGHLLECGGQISGGYFADGVKKKLDNLDKIGLPFADINPKGEAIISKVEGTGGLINLRTAKEQLLYEVMDPSNYVTPDTVADFTNVRLKELEANHVQVSGGTGKSKPSSYKVSIGYKAFYLGEGEISYSGAFAIERASLAVEIIKKRLGNKFCDLRIDFIGLPFGYRNEHPYSVHNGEVRVRVAVKADSAVDAAIVGEEIEALYTNGPAGGGGARKNVNEIIGIVSTLIDRDKIIPSVKIFES